METEKVKVETNEFRAWLETIPMGDYEAVRRQIIEKCKTKDYIFRNWKSFITPVPLLERSIINQIALEYNGTVCFKSETIISKD